ncbi:MAG: T9SS type A sorting domain-containing protein, partial [Chitinophagaceae bacterium]
NRKEVTVRIKAVTEDGQFVYSGMVYRGNLCNGKFDIGLFPNPVATDVTEVTLQAKAGIFNGRYSIMMTDAMGKEVKKTEANYTNQLQVSFKTGFISAGTYFLTVTGEDGVASMVRFVKQ